MDLAELTALVKCMSALHSWELENMPFMETTTGRHLYYMVARRAIAEQGQLDKSLKDLFTSPHFTERGLRNRMQEMSEQGIFTTYQSSADGRNKHLIPTEVFYEHVFKHAQQIRRLLRETFLLIKR
jgi:hypothetical protein